MTFVAHLRRKKSADDTRKQGEQEPPDTEDTHHTAMATAAKARLSASLRNLDLADLIPHLGDGVVMGMIVEFSADHPELLPFRMRVNTKWDPPQFLIETAKGFMGLTTESYQYLIEKEG